MNNLFTKKEKVENAEQQVEEVSLDQKFWQSAVKVNYSNDAKECIDVFSERMEDLKENKELSEKETKAAGNFLYNCYTKEQISNGDKKKILQEVISVNPELAKYSVSAYFTNEYKNRAVTDLDDILLDTLVAESSVPNGGVNRLKTIGDDLNLSEDIRNNLPEEASYEIVNALHNKQVDKVAAMRKRLKDKNVIPEEGNKSGVVKLENKAKKKTYSKDASR